MFIYCSRKIDKKILEKPLFTGSWVVFQDKLTEPIMHFHFESASLPTITFPENVFSCSHGKNSTEEIRFGWEVSFFKNGNLFLKMLGTTFKNLLSSNFDCFLPRLNSVESAKKISRNPWTYCFLQRTIYFPLNSDIEFYFEIENHEVEILDELICCAITIFSLHYDS